VSSGRLWESISALSDRTAVSVTTTRATRGLELVERDRPAGFEVSEAGGDAFPCSGNTVEEVGNAAGLGIDLVECLREQRARYRSLLNMESFSELAQSYRVLLVERNVDPAHRHAPYATRTVQLRAELDEERSVARAMLTPDLS
jgi:hypothetical protein